jgi:hypothetical protein
MFRMFYIISIFSLRTRVMLEEKSEMIRCPPWKGALTTPHTLPAVACSGEASQGLSTLRSGPKVILDIPALKCLLENDLLTLPLPPMKLAVMYYLPFVGDHEISFFLTNQDDVKGDLVLTITSDS